MIYTAYNKFISRIKRPYVKSYMWYHMIENTPHGFNHCIIGHLRMYMGRNNLELRAMSFMGCMDYVGCMELHSYCQLTTLVLFSLVFSLLPTRCAQP